MRDDQLAKGSVWAAALQVFAGLAFVALFVVSPEYDWIAWITMAAGVLSILSGARSARTEVRLLESHLRIINFSGTTDVPLKDIVGIMPDKSLRGPLSLRLIDTPKPLIIESSPRSGKAREELRKKLQEALVAR